MRVWAGSDTLSVCGGFPLTQIIHAIPLQEDALYCNWRFPTKCAIAATKVLAGGSMTPAVMQL
jgi:hypothetical protein